MSLHETTIRVSALPKNANNSGLASSDGANTPDSTDTIAEGEIEVVDLTAVKEEDNSLQDRDTNENKANKDTQICDNEEVQIVPSKKTHSVEYLDLDGRLRLRLPRGEIIVVPSARMQSVSKIWHAMIQELPQTLDGEMRELYMPDDNGKAILILARIVHGRFRQVSSALAVRLIHELA
jgi:hypothetical protein